MRGIHQSTERTARMSIAVFNPSMNAVRLPVTGSICSTLEVPAGNGKPRNSVTRSWPACVVMPVGTASTTGPPIVGNTGFATVGNSASVEDAPFGTSTLPDCVPPAVGNVDAIGNRHEVGMDSRPRGP